MIHNKITICSHQSSSIFGRFEAPPHFLACLLSASLKEPTSSSMQRTQIKRGNRPQPASLSTVSASPTDSIRLSTQPMSLGGRRGCRQMPLRRPYLFGAIFDSLANLSNESLSSSDSNLRSDFPLAAEAPVATGLPMGND